MAKLSKDVVQKLVVLYAVSRWQRGAYGPVRIQKTLFFADKENQPHKRLLTFKKYFLGQYSDDLSASLNALKAAGRLNCVFDGPAERIRAVLPLRMKTVLRDFFTSNLPEWTSEFDKAFSKWGYLKNDEILKRAHDHDTYTKSEFEEVIFESALKDYHNFPQLDPDTAETLVDLVDADLGNELRDRFALVSKLQQKNEDWRAIYFGDDD